MAAPAGPFLASPNHHLHFLPHHSAPLQPREQFLRLNAARGRQTRDHDKGRVEKEIKGNEEIIWNEMPVYAPGSRSFQHRAFQFLSPPHTHSALSLFDVQFFIFYFGRLSIGQILPMVRVADKMQPHFRARRRWRTF